jgi:hypothetical protein
MRAKNPPPTTMLMTLTSFSKNPGRRFVEAELEEQGFWQNMQGGLQGA